MVLGRRSRNVAATAMLPLAVFLALTGARADEAGRDLHSYARPDQVAVDDLDLDLGVDFPARVLRGVATLHINRVPGAPNDAPLRLDTRSLTIREVMSGADLASLRPAAFKLGEVDKILGAPLTIELAPGDRFVRICYETSPGASALQWLDPPLTSGKVHPFLFTQSEAIHARSWIPIQDSPAVRIRYKAKVTVPKGLKAVMAADLVTDGTSTGVFSFAMKEPIPPYLVALGVGDLAFRSLGPRTGVWAEPDVLRKAADEFADTEKMVEAAEKRFGPYRWGRYDLLVLPPSFPFGGMENPKLTFATPTILAGDRSLVALVAHELAHSWSGNLVTNATWRDFWLNEGFTVYIERRIVEDVYGPEVAAMERVLGLQDLRDELKSLPPRDQILHVDLKGRDPDDGFTRVPYEKGALFLTTIEQAVGREAFDPFLKGYFDSHAFRSITTADFLNDLEAKLFAKVKPATPIDVKAWTEDPGLNVPFTEPRSEALSKIDAVAKSWAAGKITLAEIDTKGWVTQQWLHFLLAMPETLPASKMAELDAIHGFTKRQNVEIAGQWLLMSIRSDYAPSYPRLEVFLTSIGRRKFLMPLYNELKKTPEGLKRGRAIYAKARPGYHPIAVESVDRVLGMP